MQQSHTFAAGLRSMLRWAICAIVIVQLFPAGTANAELPYVTKTSDSSGAWIASPNAYVPAGIWGGLKGPEDLFIAKNDLIYVADTGNDRIVQMNKRGDVLRTIPADNGKKTDNSAAKDALLRPEGVFVAETGDIYVADTGNKRIAVFDAEGRFMKEIATPKSALIPKTFVYLPSKVILDQRGYMYIATKGGYQGLLQLTPEGEFAGFYGANKVSFSWIESLKRKFYTEEQLKEEQARLPGAITNMTADQRGFIYTVNKDLKSGQLKRLNFGGVDLLKDTNFAPWVGPLDTFWFRDVHVDDEGIIMVIEAEGGRIYQYDANGELLFAFGQEADTTERLGLFRRPTSVIADSEGTIYISDAELNLIQIFKRTYYGGLVHQAVSLDNQGKYEDARKLWEEINRYNGMYERAYLGMARAQYQAGEYADALFHYELASDKQGYSNSFWQIRMAWLQRYFGFGMTGLCLIAAVFIIGRKLRKRKTGSSMARLEDRSASQLSPRMPAMLKRLLVILRYPVKGMYELSESGNVRWIEITALLVAGYMVNIAGKAVVSYLYAEQRFELVDLRLEAAVYFLPWLTWVIANYLTGSVMKGEGSFKKIAAVSSYALAPYVLIMLPVQWFSNALTLQEDIFYQAASFGIAAWVALLMFIGTQTVHNYNTKEAIGMVSVSAVTLACLWIFGFVLVGLFYQAADFLTELGKEVMRRV